MRGIPQIQPQRRRAVLTVAAVVAVGVALLPVPAHAITARYKATLSGEQLYSSSGSYTASSGGCGELYTAGISYHATFRTAQFRLRVSSKQGKTFSPNRLSAAVEQESTRDERSEISGDSGDCGVSSDPPLETRQCGEEMNRNLLVMRLSEDTEATPVNNSIDAVNQADDRLTVDGSLLNHCYPGIIGDNQVVRRFFPATTGSQKLAKLLSPNTKRVTLRGSRVQRETGGMRPPDDGIPGDWDSLLRTSWKLVLKRTR